MRKSKSAERVENLIKTAKDGTIEWKEKELRRPAPTSSSKEIITPELPLSITPILRRDPVQPPIESRPNVIESPTTSRRASRRREQRKITHQEIIDSLHKEAITNQQQQQSPDDDDMPKIVVKIGLERFAGNGLIPGSKRTNRQVRNRGQSYHEKVGLLTAFGEGVIRSGDMLAQPHDSFDVLFILQNRASEEPEWGKFTNNRNRKVLFVNRDIFSFYNRTNHAYQITIKKYPDDPDSIIADYKYSKPTQEKLAKFLGAHPDFIITQIPKLGKEILLCMNASKGFGRDGSDPVAWATSVVSRVKMYTDDTIRIRPHPRDSKIIPTLIRCYRDDRKVLFSDPRSETLHQFLDRGRAAIVYNSTISVSCVMRGIPVYLEGTNNVAFPMNAGSLDTIDRPERFSLPFECRRDFIYSLIPSVWTMDEMRRGEAWRYYKKELYSNA